MTPETLNYWSHPFSGAAIALILSAAVRALPVPGTTTGFSVAIYTWLYRFANGILSNYDLAAKPVAEKPSV